MEIWNGWSLQAVSKRLKETKSKYKFPCWSKVHVAFSIASTACSPALFMATGMNQDFAVSSLQLEILSMKMLFRNWKEYPAWSNLLTIFYIHLLTDAFTVASLKQNYVFFSLATRIYIIIIIIQLRPQLTIIVGAWQNRTHYSLTQTHTHTHTHTHTQSLINKQS